MILKPDKPLPGNEILAGRWHHDHASNENRRLPLGNRRASSLIVNDRKLITELMLILFGSLKFPISVIAFHMPQDFINNVR